MNPQKFTKKSIEAINEAQSAAIDFQNMNVEQEHLLYALTAQENGLIPQLITRMGADTEQVTNYLSKLIGEMPKVTGSGREANTVYISQDVDKCLNKAEETAKNMRDDFVSVEHIMLALFDTANDRIKKFFKTFDISKDKFLDILKDVRDRKSVV